MGWSSDVQKIVWNFFLVLTFDKHPTPISLLIKSLSITFSLLRRVRVGKFWVSVCTRKLLFHIVGSFRKRLHFIQDYSHVTLIKFIFLIYDMLIFWLLHESWRSHRPLMRVIFSLDGRNEFKWRKKSPQVRFRIHHEKVGKRVLIGAINFNRLVAFNLEGYWIRSRERNCIEKWFN